MQTDSRGVALYSTSCRGEEVRTVYAKDKMMGVVGASLSFTLPRLRRSSIHVNLLLPSHATPTPTKNALARPDSVTCGARIAIE